MEKQQFASGFIENSLRYLLTERRVPNIEYQVPSTYIWSPIHHSSSLEQQHDNNATKPC